MTYVVMVRIWDPYAGEGGDWVWKHLNTLKLDEKVMNQIKKGLRALGLQFAIGRVEAEG